MKRQIPSLPAIRALEAAAQRLSFREAATDINVTPSAISHQVKTLEEFLGVSLFLRKPGGLALTAAGRSYLADITPLLDGLDASTRRVSRSKTAEPLKLLATPGFAARWLVPRLHRFAGHERIEIAVSQGAPCTDFARNAADVVIHWGAEPVPGAVVEPMMESGRYPVASAELIAREGIHQPQDLFHVTLLRDEVLDAWDAWFRLAGLAPARLPGGPRFAHCELSLTAAERSQGVALAYAAMARATVAEGRLLRLFDIETTPITIYSFAYPESRRRCPEILALRRWIFEEVAAECTQGRQATVSAAE